MSREVCGWPLYTIVIAMGQVRRRTSSQCYVLMSYLNPLFFFQNQMLSATSFQITLLTGRNWQDDLQLYVLGGVFLAASAVWYTLFRLKPSVYVLSAPWIFFGLAFFLIALPSLSSAIHPTHRIMSSIATWSYAVASAAAFLFFGLNFGEEAVCLFIACCPIYISSSFAFSGRSDRGVDPAGMRCTRLAANLGRGALVLGIYLERTAR